MNGIAIDKNAALTQSHTRDPKKLFRRKIKAKIDEGNAKEEKEKYSNDVAAAEKIRVQKAIKRL